MTNNLKVPILRTVLYEIVQLEGGTFLILIDYKDRRPIYEQIIDNFQQMILCGAMARGEPMPSVRSLAMELSLNPNTIQRAYQELERNGYIYTVKGKGSFVSENSDAALNKKKEIIIEMEKLFDKAVSSGFSKGDISDMWQQVLEERD